MQKRKNTRLLIILTAMIVLTIVTYLLLQRDTNFTVSDTGLFAIDDVSQIDSVTFHSNDTVTLHFKNNEWFVNGRYTADPGKLTVLFAILNQVRARRPLAQAEQDRIDSLFNATGVNVRFFEGNELVKEFMVTGLEENGITYFRNNGGTYVVNIPGYRSYLAAIFQMNTSGWRDKLIFDEVSWNNLERVDVNFPSEPENDFSIVPDENFFRVEGIAATDSLKLLDYIDRVSVLMADEYFEKQEAPDSLKEKASLMVISVTDIRNRPFRLSLYQLGKENYYYYMALKDSSDWLKLNKEKVDPLIKEPEFFNKDKQ